MKTASLPLLLLTFAAAADSASAGVRVEVDPGAPFTEADLADAVEIRTPNGGGEVVVRVAKLGMDQLVIIVGDKSQVVTLPDRDRASSSRVVALVVTGMLDGEAVARPAADAGELMAPELAPPPRPRKPRTSYLTSFAWSRDDNGYVIPYLNLGAARVIAPNTRLVGTIGFAHFSGYLDTSSTIIPMRVGFEGHSGGAAIEIGGQIVNFRETSCGAAEWGLASSVYGVGKIFLPVNGRTRIVTELGGHYGGTLTPTMCNSATNYTSYGGWFGAGVEWAH
jgi:hypothetical protein